MSIALVVDDDVVARTTHTAILSQLDSLSVVGAASVSEAIAVLAHVSPDFAVVDLLLPDGTGLDVVAALEAHQPMGIVIVSAHLSRFEGTLRCSQKIHKLGKPAPHDKLLELARRAIVEPPSAGPFSAVEYLQLACLGRHTLELRCNAADFVGRILIKDGEVWQAECDGKEGGDAFNWLVTRPGLRVSIGDAPSFGARNIEGGWEGLLLNAIRLEDEADGEIEDDIVFDLSSVAPPAFEGSPQKEEKPSSGSVLKDARQRVSERLRELGLE